MLNNDPHHLSNLQRKSLFLAGGTNLWQRKMSGASSYYGFCSEVTYHICIFISVQRGPQAKSDFTGASKYNSVTEVGSAERNSKEFEQ